jgi:hypothetical protein
MNITKIWNEHGFNILVGLCITFILVVGLYNIFKKTNGTWDKNYTYNPLYKKQPEPSSTYIHQNNVNKTSKGEQECRRVLEKIFNKPFPNYRPEFMKNEITKSNLELDCYCDELKLAVEYNGIQHYKYLPYFHSNKDKFRTQQYRDYIKRDLCKKNGITLIEVPYTVKINEIENYIKNALKKI